MKKYQRNRILIAVAAIVVVGATWLLTRDKEHDVRHRPVAEVSAATAEAVALTLDAQLANDGVVQPKMSATLSPKIMSTVTDVLVREGDRVSKGQVLVRLEARDLAANVAQARAAASAARSSAESALSAAQMEEEVARTDIQSATAAVREAKAHLDMVRTGARRQERTQASLQVDQAQAQYDLAVSEARRMRTLFEQDVVTRQRLEQAEASEKSARAALESAKAQVDLITEGSRTEEIRAAEERLSRAEASLEAAKTRQISARMRKQQAEAAEKQTVQARASLQGAETMADYAVIRAPFAGVITHRYVDPGDQVAPGIPVIQVEDRSEWRVEAGIPETDAVALEVGDRIRVLVDSISPSPLNARIAEIRPAGDIYSHSVNVKASVLESHPRLKSGLFARLLLDGGRETAVLVPSEAVIDRDGLSRVWVVGADDTATLRIVTTGETREDGVVILSGVRAGERVAISNLLALSDGARILGAAR